MATTSDPPPLTPDDLSPPPHPQWLRITGEGFADPLGWGLRESRFVPAGASWGGIYLAADIVTAFREAVVRDRALALAPPIVPQDFSTNGVVLVQVAPALRLVDLVEGPLSTLLDTDRRAGRLSRDAATWSAAWRADALNPDGILYPSRFTGRACVFVFDRAVPKLRALWRRRLDRLPDPQGAALAQWVRRHTPRFPPQP